ncbi:MAG: transcription-repair coupling factor, partial [Peptostreptococcus sp.]|nr:transcription-repair coupling factor [Peptostreptococcus sp.]
MEDVLVYPLKNSKDYNDILDSIGQDGNIQITGLTWAGKQNLAYSLFKDLSRQVLYVASTEYEAKRAYEELSVYLKDKVSYLGSNEILFYNLDARDRKVDARRLKVFIKLINKDKSIFVTSVDALTRKYMPKKLITDNTFKLKVGRTQDIQELTQKLVDLGYQRVVKVEGFGQFSVRGGIVDIFTLMYDFPLRIEFFDDEIDSIREFDVYSQKSIDKKKSVTITPSRDFIYPKDVTGAIEKIKSEIRDDTDLDVHKNLERIENREYFDGLENYIDYLYDDQDKSLFEYLAKDALIYVDDFNRYKERFKNVSNEYRDLYLLNLERGVAIKSQGSMLYSMEDVYYWMQDRKLIVNTHLAKAISDMNMVHNISIECRDIPSYNGKIDLLVEDIKRLRHSGYKIIIAAATKDRA